MHPTVYAVFTKFFLARVKVQNFHTVSATYSLLSNFMKIVRLDNNLCKLVTLVVPSDYFVSDVNCNNRL